VLRALQPGNGRGNRCEANAELPERLAEAGVEFDPSDLAEALIRLENAGLLLRVQRQPQEVHPVLLIGNGRSGYDKVDKLAAGVARAIKARGERFESEDELTRWLTEDSISFDLQSLAAALAQLEHIGRLKRPRQDQWNSSLPLPGFYMEPGVHSE
jgi:hypothetical protein